MDELCPIATGADSPKKVLPNRHKIPAYRDAPPQRHAHKEARREPGFLVCNRFQTQTAGSEADLQRGRQASDQIIVKLIGRTITISLAIKIHRTGLAAGQ